jgi:lysophospholipase L1-like esterase
MKNKYILYTIILFLAATIVYILYNLNQKSKNVAIQILPDTNEPFGYYSVIRSFEAQQRSSNDVVFLGDSRIAGFDWSSQFSDFQVVNRGITGDSLLGLQYRMKEILREKPKAIVLECGFNDLRNIDFELYHKPQFIAYVCKNFASLIDTFQQKSPNTKLVVQSVLPVYGHVINCMQCDWKMDTLNAHFLTICKQKKIDFLDLTPILTSNKQLKLEYTFDGIHLNPKGYLVWSDFLKSALKGKF